MTKAIKLIITIVGLIFISCTDRKEIRSGEKYSTDVNYHDDNEYPNPERNQIRTERLLSRDTLYIFFEGDFKSDTVDVRVNDGYSKILFLTTDKSLGLAGLAHYGDIKSIEKIEIKKNSGIPLTIQLTDKSMNIWTVNFYNDTLWAQRRRYLPWYE
jgi:hypothetical protein